MVRVGADGVTVHCGPSRPVVAGVPVPLDVVVDSRVEREVAVVVAGEAFTVAAGGAGVATIDVDGDVDGAPDADRSTARRCRSPRQWHRRTAPGGGCGRRRCARWSVTDAAGGASFPDGVLRMGLRGPPFFHAEDVTLRVPAGALDRRVHARP